MSKTLEQMAKGYVEQASLEYEEAAGGYYGFIAGYQAAKDQLANADKVMPQWISVKDRLPPPQREVLWWNKAAQQAGVSSWEYMPHYNDTMIEWGDAGNVLIKNFTYWMPLPAPPKEEK